MYELLSTFATEAGCFVCWGGVLLLIVGLVMRTLAVMLMILPRCLGIPFVMLFCLVVVFCDAVRSNSVVLCVSVVGDLMVVEDERIVVMLRRLWLFCGHCLCRGG